MNRQSVLINLALVACVSILWPLALVAQSRGAQSEQEIRRVVYEQRYAQATGDVETFKRLTAERTLTLYRFYVEVLSGNIAAALSMTDAPPGGDNRKESPATSPEREVLLDLMIRGAAATLSESMSPEEIKERARRESAGSITFINERKARVSLPDAQEYFVVLEGGQWKIDDTEYLKKEILSLEQMSAPNFTTLTPQQKERIRGF